MENIDNNSLLLKSGIKYEYIKKEEPKEEVKENFTQEQNIKQEQNNEKLTQKSNIFSINNIKICVFSLILFFIFGQDFFIFSSLPIYVSMCIRGILLSVSLMTLINFL